MKTQPRPLKFTSALAIAAIALATLVSGCSTCCQAKSPKRVLLVTTTMGFRHSSIPTLERVIGKLAQQSGDFTVAIAGLDSGAAEFKDAEGKADNAKIKEAMAKVLAEKMSAAALKNYDAVIFANTTGDLPLPDPQAFVDWVKSGKAFIGVHAATDTFPNFRPYLDMIGGQFKSHGAQVEVEPINQDAKSPACCHIPAGWKIFDEIYLMQSFDRAQVHGLLALDKHPNNQSPGDYPIAWCRNYGKGRVFYTSLGHREDVWDANFKDKNGERKNAPEVAMVFQQHLLGGIQWALGLKKGDATPQTMK